MLPRAIKERKIAEFTMGHKKYEAEELDEYLGLVKKILTVLLGDSLLMRLYYLDPDNLVRNVDIYLCYNKAKDELYCVRAGGGKLMGHQMKNLILRYYRAVSSPSEIGAATSALSESLLTSC